MASGRLPRTALLQALMVTMAGLIVVAPSTTHAAASQPTLQAQDAQRSPRGMTPGQPTAREVHGPGSLAHPEGAAVRIALDAYLRGHETGDPAQFRRAFWKDARLWWVRDGQVATRTADEYIAALSGRRPTDDGHRRRLVTLEIAGETAVATIEIDYPSVRLTDQLTLQKIGDEWRIISKAFYSEPRATVI